MGAASEAIRAAAVAAPTMPAAFEDLFRREYPRVVGIAMRIVRDSDEAEDVAQDVFVSFYRKHSADAGYAPAWLHAAAAHTALNAIRSRERCTRREVVHESLRDTAVDPALHAEDTESRAEVRAALARIDERSASPSHCATAAVIRRDAAALGLRRPSIGTFLARAEEAFRREVTR
jgi:RNA polymerase sigma-70 factor (ECF subfamily)